MPLDARLPPQIWTANAPARRQTIARLLAAAEARENQEQIELQATAH